MRRPISPPIGRERLVSGRGAGLGSISSQLQEAERRGSTATTWWPISARRSDRRLWREVLGLVLSIAVRCTRAAAAREPAWGYRLTQKRSLPLSAPAQALVDLPNTFASDRSIKHAIERLSVAILI